MGRGQTVLSGVLHGVGVGPGDPELLTLRALRLIQASPVLAYPAPERGDAFARAIVAPHVDHDPIELPIRTPMAPARFPDAAVYRDAARRIATHLDAGRDVVCLCEGDPFVYGSFQYLFAEMAQTHEVTLTPGVSAITAGAAAAALPLSAGGDRIAVLPATLPDEALAPMIAAAETAIFLKLGRHAPRLRALLDRLGRLDDAIYVERASLPTQKVTPFAAVRDAPYFALVILKRPA